VVGQWFSPGTQVSSTNIADRHDISDILVESDFKHHNPNLIQTAVYCLVSLMSMKSRSKTLPFILIAVSGSPLKVIWY
jgi:predicted ATP-dependent Lon-type protease